MAGRTFPGRVGLQQRVLPAYRAPFFEALGNACQGGLSLFAGEARAREAITPAGALDGVEHTRARNIHLLSGPFYTCYQIGLMRWLERCIPDVLIMEANPRYLSSKAGIRRMHAQDKPVIGWGLGAAGQRGPAAGLRRRIRREFLFRFDALIAYSEQGADEFRGMGVPPDRVFVAGNAVSAPPASMPEREPMVDRPARLLYVGRLQARKRVDVLLTACARLSRPAELKIVGDGPERANLERMAQEVFPAAEFAGSQHGQALEACFAWADLFVLPGTGGLAVQEAMAAGLPVIVAEGDGTERDLVSADNGWLVPVGDAAALHRQIEMGLDDPIALKEMGRRSHTLVRERFNIERMTEIFVQVLTQVCER